MAFPDNKELERLFYWMQVQPAGSNVSNWQYALNVTEQMMTFVATYFEVRLH